MNKRVLQIADYSARRGWGHDYTITQVLDDGRRLQITGWFSGPEGQRLSRGDYIIFPNREGSSRYCVDSVHYYADPWDMYDAVVTFAPRKVEQKAEESD